MTSKDKTRQKLVASMRKTKETASESHDTVKEEVSAKQTAPTPAPAPAAPRSRTASTPVASSSAARGTDPYQSGRRVWPD